MVLKISENANVRYKYNPISKFEMGFASCSHELIQKSKHFSFYYGIFEMVKMIRNLKKDLHPNRNLNMPIWRVYGPKDLHKCEY